MPVYWQGLAMGLAYVAPIGLQNLYVINTALTQPKKRVYATALITIFFDISLGLSCFLGIGALMKALPWLEKLVLGAGSLVVIWIGAGLLRGKGGTESSRRVDVPLGQVIRNAFVVTWINPQALIDGTMLLGAARAALPAGTDAAYIAGFTSASALWFLGLSTVISLFSAHLSEKLLRGINLVCGAVIVFYGLKLLWSFFAMVVPGFPALPF